MIYLDNSGSVLVTDGGLLRCDCCDNSSASFICESEEVDAELCGYSEFDGFSSSPPKKYRTQTHCGSMEVGIDYVGDNSSNRKYYFSGDQLLDPDHTPANCAQRSYDENCNVSGTLPSSSQSAPGYFTISGIDGNPTSACFHYPLRYEPAGSRIVEPLSGTVANLSKSILKDLVDNQSWTLCSNTGQATLSVEDTEQDAIDRETPTVGTDCSSLWETRNTGFTFVSRTSGYTIECVDLVVGLEYEVTPIIRKRTAVIGNYGQWEAVTVSPVTFTATATTETIDDGGNPIELDHVQGYEYEITSVHIEKKA